MKTKPHSAEANTEAAEKSGRVSERSPRGMKISMEKAHSRERMSSALPIAGRGVLKAK